MYNISRRMVDIAMYVDLLSKFSFVDDCYDDNCKNNDNCKNDDNCKKIITILTTTVKKSTTTVKNKFDDNCKKSNQRQL